MLLGQKWIKSYGEGIDYLHFHNYMEMGYCYEGQGELVIAEKSFRFTGKQFSVIPQNCPHTTNSDPGTKSRWEYLYVDVDQFLGELYPGRGNEKQKERMRRRINSRAFFMDESLAPKMAGDIRKILDITREKKEFYFEEAKAALTSLLVTLARENKDIAQEVDLGQNGGLAGLWTLSQMRLTISRRILWSRSGLKSWRPFAISARRTFGGRFLLQ